MAASRRLSAWLDPLWLSDRETLRRRRHPLSRQRQYRRHERGPRSGNASGPGHAHFRWRQGILLRLARRPREPRQSSLDDSRGCAHHSRTHLPGMATLPRRTRRRHWRGRVLAHLLAGRGWSADRIYSGLVFWRYVSLASISAASSLPLLVYLLYAPGHAPPYASPPEHHSP